MGLIDDEDEARALAASAAVSKPERLRQQLAPAAARGDELMKDFATRAIKVGLPLVTINELTFEAETWRRFNTARPTPESAHIYPVRAGEARLVESQPTSISAWVLGDQLRIDQEGRLVSSTVTVLEERDPEIRRNGFMARMRNPSEFRQLSGYRRWRVTPTTAEPLYVEGDGLTTCMDCVLARHDSHHEQHSSQPVARWMADALRNAGR